MAVLDAGKAPLKAFLEKHTQERECQFFLKSVASIWPKEQVDKLRANDLFVMVPSFTLSELVSRLSPDAKRGALGNARAPRCRKGALSRYHCSFSV